MSSRSEATAAGAGVGTYTHADVVQLVQAARQAAFKIKCEYDRGPTGCASPATECWAEGEALWHALIPYEDIDPFCGLANSVVPGGLWASQHQRRRLWATVRELGVSEARLRGIVYAYTGQSSVMGIPADRFGVVLAAVRAVAEAGEAS